MARIFISYQQKNQRWADWIAWTLESLGHSCFYQIWDAKKTDLVIEQINREIENCDFFLAVFSESYFSSRYCCRELNAAIKSDVDRGTTRTSAVIVERCKILPIYSELACFNFVDIQDQKQAVAELATLGAARLKPTRPPLFPGEAFPANQPRHQDVDSPHPRQADARQSKATAPEVIEQEPLFPNIPNAVTPAFLDFTRLLLGEDERTKEVDRRPESRLPLPVREPNFILFNRGQRVVLAICDRNAPINTLALQRTNEPQIRARLLERNLIPHLGFTTRFVHPMFYDDHNVIDRVFIDGNIFFQFLYFPHSSIQIPSLENGNEVKIIVSISAFIRTMLKFHGEHKVIFATISKGKWPDETLITGLRQINCFTRFAPTPSKGLHFGNVRSALIPYILYRRNAERNLFFLRYDDTNRGTVQERYVSQIREELRWLGFAVKDEHIFRQSETTHKKVYEDVLLLLRNSSYVKPHSDGSLWLNWEHRDLQMAYWLDVNRGAVIVHSLPVADRRRRLGGLSLVDSDGGSFKYKFTGTIDDLLFSSHVVRDIRQEGLTARQSLIRNAIYRAWSNPESTEQVDAAKKRIEHYRREVLGSATLPLPFLAPPIYCHVANVVDTNRKILKKRKMTEELYDTGDEHLTGGLEIYRRQQWLPETLISLLLASIIPRKAGIALSQHRIVLGQLAAEIGVAPFIDLVAIECSIDWLITSPRRNVQITEKILQDQERCVIRALSYFNFSRRIRAFQVTGNRRVVSNEVLERLYNSRHEMGSWREILLVAFADDIRLGPSEARIAYIKTLEEFIYHRRQSGVDFKDKFAANLKQAVAPDLAARQVRLALTGRESGPPIFVLGQILGLNEAKLRCFGSTRRPK